MRPEWKCDLRLLSHIGERRPNPERRGEKGAWSVSWGGAERPGCVRPSSGSEDIHRRASGGGG